MQPGLTDVLAPQQHAVRRLTADGGIGEPSNGDGKSNFSETVDISSSTGLIVGQTTTGMYAITANGRGTVTSLTTSGIFGVILLAMLSLILAVVCAPKWRHQPSLRPTFAFFVLLATLAIFEQ